MAPPGVRTCVRMVAPLLALTLAVQPVTAQEDQGGDQAGVLDLPVSLSAQSMPAEVRRGAGMGGLSMSDGEPISFLLEWSHILELRSDQRESLMGIRRRLRAANAQHMKQLDSLADFIGLNLEPRRLTEEDRQKLQRFEALSQPITDSIRVNNDAAKIQARELLDSVQIVRLDSLARRQRDSGSTGARPGVHR